MSPESKCASYQSCSRPNLRAVLTNVAADLLMMFSLSVNTQMNEQNIPARLSGGAAVSVDWTRTRQGLASISGTEWRRSTGGLLGSVSPTFLLLGYWCNVTDSSWTMFHTKG